MTREQRLKEEGRWEAYQARLVEIRAEHPTACEQTIDGLIMVEFGPSSGMRLRRRAEKAQERTAPQRVEKWKVSKKHFLDEDGHARSATHRKRLEWVASNILVADPRPCDAPDAAAWALLRDVREDIRFRKMFWVQMFQRTGQVGEVMDKFRDDQKDDTRALLEELKGELGSG